MGLQAQLEHIEVVIVFRTSFLYGFDSISLNFQNLNIITSFRALTFSVISILQIYLANELKGIPQR